MLAKDGQGWIKSGGYLPPLPFATSTPAGPCDSVAECSNNKLPNRFKPAIAHPKGSPTRAAFIVRARWGFLLYLDKYVMRDVNKH
jgi:hypothetical protein